jgi:hypothetical protein
MLVLSLQADLDIDQALRAFANAASSSRAASGIWPGAWLNVSANQAIISASIGSFFARRPADCAKLRTRRGLSLGTSVRRLRQ